MHRNDLHDITAELLSKVCNDIAIEPPLQSLSGEVLSLPTDKMMPEPIFTLMDFGGSGKVPFLT